MKESLVSISEYSRHFNVDRATIYELIKKGTLTRYEVGGKPYLSLKQRPKGIKRYGNIRKRRVK